MRKKLLFLVFIFCGLWAKSDSAGVNIHYIPSHSIFSVTDTGKIIFKLTIPSGYYIYANSLGDYPGTPTDASLILVKSNITNIVEVSYSEPLLETDYEGKDVFIYRDSVYILFDLPVLSAGSYYAEFNASFLRCNNGGCRNGEITTNFTIEIGKELLSKELSFYNTTNSIKFYLGEKREVVDTSFDTISSDDERLLFRAFISTLKPTPFLPGCEVSSLLLAILFGLLAGVILNITPCVLPVISIKIISLVKQAGETKWKIKLHGFVFSAGIISVFLVLAGLSAFAGYSWGEIFQNSWFLIVMIMFVIFMALSLFGLFNISIPGLKGVVVKNKKGVKPFFGTFFNGVVATLLATPCSGPLMGGVMAWSLTRSAPEIFAVFSAAGVGMALPYFILTLRPSLLKYIPKGGKWLLYFERILALLLLGTAFYLLTLLRDNYFIPVIILVLLFSFFIYLIKKFFKKIKYFSLKVFLFITFFSLLGGYIYFYIPSDADSQALPEKVDITSLWQPFSIRSFLQNLEDDRTVVLDFTAEWCINCRVLEKTILNSAPVKSYIKKNKIVCYYVDMTSSNPLMKEFQRALHSVSIPYVACFYGSSLDKSRPVFLRDIFTADTFLKMLKHDSSEKKE